MTIFSKLCYDHLSINIDSDINQALSRRLGSPTNGKIQKLLIVMKSESSCKCHPPWCKKICAAQVTIESPHPSFINADLTPTEATLAYESRVKRRERLKIKLNNPQSSVLSSIHVLHSDPPAPQSSTAPIEFMDAIEGPLNPSSCPDQIDASQHASQHDR